MKKKLILKFLDGVSLLVFLVESFLCVFGRRRRVPVLVYHKTSPSLELEQDIWNVAPTTFRKQLNILKNKQYQVISVETLLGYLKNAIPLPRKTVCITFDDGYSQNYTNVIKELEDKEFTADFYVSTKYVDEKAPYEFLWKSNLTSDQKKAIFPFEKKQLYRIKEKGFGIHSHAHEHLHFGKLDAEEIDRQITKSFCYLEIFGVNHSKSFVAPYGVWGLPLVRTISILKNNKVDSAFLGSWGSVKGDSNLLNLPRLPVYGYDSSLSFYLKISGAFDWLGPFHKIWHEFKTRKQT